MLGWLRRRRTYAFRTVIYEQDGTWVAYAADLKLSGFCDSREQALGDVRKMLQQFVESLNGSTRSIPVKSDDELRRLGDLTFVEIVRGPGSEGCRSV